MKKVEKELTIKCSMCSSIIKTPVFASLGDDLDCENCHTYGLVGILYASISTVIVALLESKL